MNAAQRRLVFWSLTCGAIALHLSIWSWGVGGAQLPLFPVSTAKNLHIPAGTADATQWRRENPIIPAQWFGLRSWREDAATMGLWLPLAMLIAAQFVRLGQRPVSAPRP